MLISHSYVSLPEDLHFDTHWAISSMELLYAKGILRQHLVHSFPCGLKEDTFPSTNQQSTHQQKSLLDHPCAINKICPCWTSSKMNEWTIMEKKNMKTQKKTWKLPNISVKASKNLRKNSQKSENLPEIREKKSPGLHPTSGRLHLRLSWPPGTQNCLDGLRKKAEIYTTIYTLNANIIYIYVCMYVCMYVYMVLVYLIIEWFVHLCDFVYLWCFDLFVYHYISTRLDIRHSYVSICMCYMCIYIYLSIPISLYIYIERERYIYIYIGIDRVIHT